MRICGFHPCTVVHVSENVLAKTVAVATRSLQRTTVSGQPNVFNKAVVHLSMKIGEMCFETLAETRSFEIHESYHEQLFAIFFRIYERVAYCSTMDTMLPCSTL